jgi:hypothetical protein
MTEHQLQLFPMAPSSLSPTGAREIERFGTWDARCGAPLPNYYSDRLDAGQRETYERAFRAERMKDITDAASAHPHSLARREAQPAARG